MIHSETDHEEHEGYTADLEPGTTRTTSRRHLTARLPGLSAPAACTATWNPQLVSAILNLKKDRFERESPPNPAGGDAAPHHVEDVPVIRYVSTGRSILMDDWQDPEFFTGSFPTLFPLGSGGHLPEPQERPVPGSLQAWANTPQSKVQYVSNL